MSYCQIILFSGGLPSGSIEYNNAWGGAAHIWSELSGRYLEGRSAWIHDEGKQLWALARRQDLPMFERAVHTSTFDYAYTRRENFPRLVADLREFERVHPPKGGTFSHLPAWADEIETLACEAIGFRGTSVGDNPWQKWNEVAEDYDAVPLSEGFEVYDWLAKPKP